MWCILTDISLKPDQCESLSWANDGEGPVGWTPMATSDAAGYAAAGDATMRRGQLHRRNWGEATIIIDFVVYYFARYIDTYTYYIYLSIYLSIYEYMHRHMCIYIYNIIIHIHVCAGISYTVCIHVYIYIQYIYIYIFYIYIMNTYTTIAYCAQTSPFHR